MSLSKKLYTVKIFTKISSKRFFRDRLAIFFTVIFPLVFLFIFGGLFGKSNSVSFKLAVINKSSSDFSKEFVGILQQNNSDNPDLSKEDKKGKLFKINSEITDLEAAKEKMNRGEIDATVMLPEDFGTVKEGEQNPTGQVEVLYSQNSQQAGQALGSILGDMIKGVNSRFTHAVDPFTVKSEQTNDRGLSSFDYVFSGLLGFSILGLGIFGPMNVFPELKKQGILRRLHTTTLRVWQYFLSTALSQVLIGLLSFVIQFAVAITVFHLNVVGNYFELALFLILGTLMVLGFGLAIGGWAKNERQAAPIGNLITFPMMFLSGTFFPRFLMPEWLQSVSNYIPLTPVVDGIRLIATEGKHLTDIGPQIGLVGLWMVVIYFIAFRTFSWE